MKHPVQDSYKDIVGASKGGGSSPSEANDTLITDQVIKLLHLIGEGELNLYTDSVITNPGQSIFFNGIPLVNSDGSYNFGAYDQVTGDSGLYTGGGSTYWDIRTGTPSQSPMTNPAFPSASNVVTVDQQFTGGTYNAYTGSGTSYDQGNIGPLALPIKYTPSGGVGAFGASVGANPALYNVSAANIDYCKVAIGFQQGLENVDGKGNIIGDSVEIAIDVKPHSSSSWVNVIDVVINQKSSTPAVLQYQVNNPSPGNLWDIRCRRLTEDNATSTRKNQTYLNSVEEVQAVLLPYNGIAYIGTALDAATIGGSNASIPTFTFLVKPGAIPIPSNFNPATNTYTGLWDGTFTTGVTDDPAWILWNKLTNAQYGCGLIGITASMLDKFSFYNASVFNNAQVASGITGVTEPRFTYNALTQNRQDLLQYLQTLAGTFNAYLGEQNGLITLFQDRPATSARLITKANVIGSDSKNPIYFSYSNNAVTDRITSVTATYTDSSNPQWLPTQTSVQDSTLMAQYGYQVYDMTCLGVTKESQAQRAGRYYIYTQNYNTISVNFKMGLEGYIPALYDVFDLFDDDFAGTAMGGRVISATTNTVTLDQPVVINGASPKIGVMLQDGVTYETHNITNAPGTYSTLTISGTWSVIPTKYCPYGVTTAIAPRQFRIIDLQYDPITKEVEITAQQYDGGNAYTYAEGGTVLATPVYTIPSATQPTAPTSLTSTPTTYIDPNDSLLHRGVTISWTPPPAQTVGYRLKWRKDAGQWTSVAQFAGNSWELTNIVSGVYDFIVSSVNIVGTVSAPATIQYTLDTSGGGSAPALIDVTGLEVLGGGTTWNGLDLSVEWTNPTANAGNVKDFLVTFKNTGGTLLRQVVVPPVVSNSAQDYVYTFAMNLADTNGTPDRAIAVTVQCRDTNNDLTAGTTVTLTNDAPGVPGNIAAAQGLQSAIVSWTPETDPDVVGYIIWWSDNGSFTPSSANATDCGASALAAFTALLKNTTYYYYIAAYDAFWEKDYSGAGLNLSPKQSTVTATTVGIPSGTTLPVTALDGDTFYDLTDSHLYQWTSGAWTQVAGDLVANSVTAVKINGIMGAFTSTFTNVLTALQGNIVDLSTITANIGTQTTGLIKNGSGSNSIDLSATGTTAFINTPNFTVLANGDATFGGTLSAGIVTSTALATAAVTTSKLDILSTGGTTIDMTAGQITFNNGSFMKVMGTGFGSASQFIEWYGPTQSSLTTCTETNATYYLKIDGSAYFGGTLLAGVLQNTIQGTILDSTNVADLGPYSSNGGQITITWSFSFSGLLNFAPSDISGYNAVTKQSPSAAIELQQSVGGAAFTTVLTSTISSGTHMEEAPNGVDPGFYRQFMGGSGTYTDNLDTTSTREYRLSFTSWANVNSAVQTNTLALQSIE